MFFLTFLIESFESNAQHIPNIFHEAFNLFISIFSLQAEDLLDDILSFESSSLADSLKLDASYGACGSNSDLHIKQEPSGISDAEMHAMAKDRQKKDNHNMSKCQSYRIA